jgi:hypothetical protein
MLKVKKAHQTSDSNIRALALNDYFSHVYAHGYANPHARDTAFCYCNIRGREPLRYREVVTVDVATVGTCFFDDLDWALSNHIVADQNGEWIRINVRYCGAVKLAGVYNPAQHTLIATDWVHHPDSDQAIRTIATAMGWAPRENNEEKQEILLGADPEWEAWDPRSRSVVRPRSEDCFHSELGEVGIDGAGTVPEARPTPSEDPVELYYRIRNLAKEWEKRTGLRVCLAGHTHAIGAHIHVGAPAGYRLEGDFNAFVAEVDKRVGFLVDLSGQARGVYKERRAWRAQPWGLEYRTLPSCALALEDVAVWTISSIIAIARGKQPPRRDKRISEAIRGIREVVESRVPFSFELENLLVFASSSCPGKVILSSDTWCAQWQEWAHRINAGGRVRGRVLLFGFRDSRGFVVNDALIAAELGWQHIDFSYGLGVYDISIGLPRDARVVWNENVARALERRLAQLGYLQQNQQEGGESNV